MCYNIREMTKQKLWLKKRTTRGKSPSGKSREVNGKTKLTAKNLSREVYKNQKWYSHFLLKFVICALIGMVWLRVGFVINIAGHAVSIIPLGLIVGLLILLLEKVAKYRWVEFAILLATATVGFLWPIGITII